MLKIKKNQFLLYILTCFMTASLHTPSMADPLAIKDLGFQKFILGRPAHHHVAGWFKRIKLIYQNYFQLTLEVAGEEKDFYIYTTQEGYPYYLSQFSSYSRQMPLKSESKYYANAITYDDSDPYQCAEFWSYIKKEAKILSSEKDGRKKSSAFAAKLFEGQQQSKNRDKLETYLSADLATQLYVHLGSLWQSESQSSSQKQKDQPLYIFLQYNPVTGIVNKSYNQNVLLPHVKNFGTGGPIVAKNIEAVLPLQSFSSDHMHTSAELGAWYNYTIIREKDMSEVSEDQSAHDFYHSTIEIPQLAKPVSVFSKKPYHHYLHLVDEEMIQEQRAAGLKGQYHQAYVVEVEDMDSKIYANYVNKYGFFPVYKTNPAIITFVKNNQKFRVYTKNASLIEFAKVALKTNVQVVVTTHEIQDPDSERSDLLRPMELSNYRYLTSIGLSLRARLAVAFSLSDSDSYTFVHPPVSTQSNQWFYQLMSDEFTDNVPKAEQVLQAESHMLLSQSSYHSALSNLELPIDKERLSKNLEKIDENAWLQKLIRYTRILLQQNVSSDDIINIFMTAVYLKNNTTSPEERAQFHAIISAAVAKEKREYEKEAPSMTKKDKPKVTTSQPQKATNRQVPSQKGLSNFGNVADAFFEDAFSSFPTSHSSKNTTEKKSVQPKVSENTKVTQSSSSGLSKEELDEVYSSFFATYSSRSQNTKEKESVKPEVSEPAETTQSTSTAINSAFKLMMSDPPFPFWIPVSPDKDVQSTSNTATDAPQPKKRKTEESKPNETFQSTRIAVNDVFGSLFGTFPSSATPQNLAPPEASSPDKDVQSTSNTATGPKPKTKKRKRITFWTS